MFFGKKNISSSSQFHEISGAIHLHTTYSDGGVSLFELIGAAQSLDLDYIIVTDHMTLKGRQDGFEGFHKNLMVLIGYEHNDKKNRNHYLALNTPYVYKGLNTPKQYVTAIHDDHGLGFIAHPDENRHYFGKLPPYPWTDWKIDQFDGIELWNQMSDWMENLRSWFSILKLMYPRRFMRNVSKNLLNKWDTLNQNRFVSGIGGVDAHTRRIRLGLLSITIFPIRVELQGIRTHLYLKENFDSSDFTNSKEKLLQALKNGHGFISNFRRGDARGTKIFLEQDGKIFCPGLQETTLISKSKIKVELPAQGDIIFIRNGISLTSKHGTSAEFDIKENGVYRVEVHRNGKAWIYSNPFPIGQYPIN